MKCCGSPTTSIAPKAIVAPRATAPNRAREVAAAFDALLLREALKPLAQALGFYGDTVVGVVASSVARREHGGLTDRLEREIARAEGSRPAGGGS